jgi:hypothetical protein
MMVLAEVLPFELPRALIEAGGWVVAAVFAFGVITLIIRGDLVTGRTHQREIDRADKATTQLERNNDFNKKMSAQVETLVKLVAEVLKLR